MIYAFVAICLFGGALARRSTLNCTNLDYMQNINRTRFMGKWYSVEANQQPNDTDCESINLVTENGGNYIIFEHRNRSRIEGTDDYELAPEISQDKQRLENDEEMDRFIEDFILDTDHTSYAVMTQCDSGHVVILNRDQYPTTQVLKMAHKIVRNKIGNVELYPRNLLGCGPTTPSSNSTKRIKSAPYIRILYNSRAV